jgi:hypothetical protein
VITDVAVGTDARYEVATQFECRVEVAQLDHGAGEVVKHEHVARVEQLAKETKMSATAPHHVLFADFIIEATSSPPSSAQARFRIIQVAAGNGRPCVR